MEVSTDASRMDEGKPADPDTSLVWEEVDEWRRFRGTSASTSRGGEDVDVVDNTKEARAPAEGGTMTAGVRQSQDVDAKEPVEIDPVAPQSKHHNKMFRSKQRFPSRERQGC